MSEYIISLFHVYRMKIYCTWKYTSSILLYFPSI